MSNEKFSTFYQPNKKITTEQIIKKSRFITNISPVNNKEEANNFISEISSKHSKARHNCCAFVIGAPFSSSEIYSSDDGEPAGTAGKPLLNTIQNKNIGNIAVIVTRYFGGIKLGAGGLIRAYSSSLKLAISKIKLIKHIPTYTVKISFPFEFESYIRKFLANNDIAILSVNYFTDVEIEIELPIFNKEYIKKNINFITKGNFELK